MVILKNIRKNIKSIKLTRDEILGYSISDSCFIVGIEPGSGDVGLESSGLGGFLCKNKSAVGAILDLRQS